jgi:two-component system chemotaxis sensor kinase CheA
MNLDPALQVFFVEGRELLEEMEGAALTIREMEDQLEALNAIFRAIHTIKGSAGLFGLNPIVEFTHVVESVLDVARERLREAGGGLSEELIGLLLPCCDRIRELLTATEAGHREDDETGAAQGRALLEQLRKHLPDSPARAPQSTAKARPQPAGANEAETGMWHISLRFGREVLKNGLDPLSFLRYLSTLGSICAVETMADSMPRTADMDPEQCYLGFEIAFNSAADKRTIEGAFDFVRDDCQVRILPPDSRISDYVRLIRELPEEPARIGEILVRCGSVTARELQQALDAQAGPAQGQLLGEILIEQQTAQPAVVNAALAKQQQVKEHKANEARSVRVDADKLDSLINLVGELIIAAASANLVARRARNADMQEAASTLSALVEEVRDSALQLRMVKIGATFSRFQRVVHDVSRELGKDIELRVSGEDAELDKTVVEKIGDPLTHLVRNAIDHGIEPAEVRAARGKPVKGTVALNAYHDSGSIVIEVSDDGGGLKRDRILAKAVERGLVEPGRALGDEEIYGLIFEPGFSTAEAVTNLSGRGVGMDVVKRNITALRGSVQIHSQEGIGTTVSVRLPLTLAIINGFLVGLDKSLFVVPMDMIEECVAYAPELTHDYTNLRGQVLPFIRLREMFEIEGAPARRENIVVVRHAGQKAGLVVDSLLGEFQTVIKPLGRMFSHVRCISGSSILGSGEVALILDVPALIQAAVRPRLSDSEQGVPSAATAVPAT